VDARTDGQTRLAYYAFSLLTSNKNNVRNHPIIHLTSLMLCSLDKHKSDEKG
jgi:hypothetical protein